MKKIGTVIVAALIGVTGVIAFAPSASATPTNPNEDHKVTVCHRTGSADGGELKNGYNEITVDIASSGYVKGGHTGHEQVGNGPGPDIIPAYEAFAKVKGKWEPFSFPGLNLDYVFADGTTGAEFLANGCDYNTPQYEDVRVDVKFFDPTCESPKGELELIYNENEVTYEIQGEVGPGQEVTVEFTAKDGYKIKGQSVFTHTFGNVPDNCVELIEVRAEVSYQGPNCDHPNRAVVTFGNTDAVNYEYLSGSPEPGNTVLIEATAKEGYVLVGKSLFSHDFIFGPSKEECKPDNPDKPDKPDHPNNPDKPGNPSTPPELPHTGGGLGGLGLAGGLVALGSLLIAATKSRLFA